MTKTKIPSQKKKTKQYKRGIDWLSEQVDLSILFRIKGVAGLWMPISKPRKNGLLRMERFGADDVKLTVNKNYLTSINNMGIRMADRAVLPFTEALDNLQKNCNNQTTIEFGPDIHEDVFMNILCPNFDPDSFKIYHARKVIKWYNELIEGVRNANKTE